MAILRIEAPEQAGPAHAPERDEIEHVDRKAAVDLGGLRQIADGARIQPAAVDLSAELTAEWG